MELSAYEKEHLERIRGGLGECMVLLKKNGAFPLDRPASLAAYGSGVRGSIKGGTGSGEVNSRFSISVEEGLKEAGFTLTSGKWLDDYERIREESWEGFRRELSREARAAGANVIMYAMGAVMPEPEHDLKVLRCADAAIYVLSRISGEGSDRKAVPGDVLLTKSEIRDILALDRMYERFMLVLNTGGPVDLTPVMGVGNILLLSQLGTETGRALADVLLGKVNPSGKLTTTWAAWKDYCPEITLGDKEETPYREGVYVGYRYFGTVRKRALFPFGYGLSYTEFETASPRTAIEGRRVSFTIDVKNVGKRAGKEVVQLYVGAPEGKLKKPFQELAGFAKTAELAPQETQTLRFGFDLGDLASFDESRAVYLLEPGDYVLRAGTSSENAVPVAVLALDREILLKRVRPIAPPAAVAEHVYERAARGEKLDALPRLSVDPLCFETDETVYDREDAIEPEIAALSDRELCYLAVGAFSEKGLLSSVIGSAATHVSGAAGETTSKLESKGIRPLIMADGPAGLRLSKNYYRDEKGAHAVGSALIQESMLKLLGPVARKVAPLVLGGSRAPKNAEILHQYCTAIPIGTAIAQSWNLDYARLCGDMVGEEMERFGVQLWLAPALNIHRSILCGRNFEYFSEDPLISGSMAAALTQGVQKHRGCAATIKHFAANNQEYNRYYSNSRVSERALREIYLKGFAICVRESQPHALMTSYNLINGEHSAEMRGLIEDYLRAENGFEGIVMTDWIMKMPRLGSRYPKTCSPRVAAAGGDLFMPGCQDDYRELCEALRSGTVTRRRLEINGSRVLRMIRKLRG